MKHWTLLLASLLSTATLCSSSARDTRYIVINNATGTPGGIRFDAEVGRHNGAYFLNSASSNFWGFLGQQEPDEKNISAITLIIQPMMGRVIATNIDDSIYISSDYIATYNHSVSVTTEFAGIVFHEVARIRQWDGNGAAPLWLLTGVADFVRLKGGYAPEHWAQPGDGALWDEGYGVTARFLDYCNNKKAYFVGDLNAKMKDGYSVDFFEQLMGKSIGELWEEYKAQYGG